MSDTRTLSEASAQYAPKERSRRKNRKGGTISAATLGMPNMGSTSLQNTKAATLNDMAASFLNARKSQEAQMEPDNTAMETDETSTTSASTRKLRMAELNRQRLEKSSFSKIDMPNDISEAIDKISEIQLNQLHRAISLDNATVAGTGAAHKFSSEAMQVLPDVTSGSSILRNQSFRFRSNMDRLPQFCGANLAIEERTIQSDDGNSIIQQALTLQVVPTCKDDSSSSLRTEILVKQTSILKSAFIEESPCDKRRTGRKTALFERTEHLSTK